MDNQRVLQTKSPLKLVEVRMPNIIIRLYMVSKFCLLIQAKQRGTHVSVSCEAGASMEYYVLKLNDDYSGEHASCVVTLLITEHNCCLEENIFIRKACLFCGSMC